MTYPILLQLTIQQMHRAQALKDMGRIEDAILEYDTAARILADLDDSQSHAYALKACKEAIHLALYLPSTNYSHLIKLQDRILKQIAESPPE